MRITLILVVALVTVVIGDNNRDNDQDNDQDYDQDNDDNNDNNNNDNDDNNNDNNNNRKGDCFCISDDSVDIRSSACGTEIIGQANIGDCFKYAGRNTGCRSNGWWYQFFEIDYNGKQGWAPINYLNHESDSRCGGSSEGDGVDTRSLAANEYQCQVTDGGRRVHESSSYDCVDSSCQNSCRGGQCVAYVKCKCKRNGKYPPYTGAWRPGQKVKTADGKCNRNIAPNTAIATFDSHGKYNAHAAVFIRCQGDNAVQVYDQWCSQSVGYRTYDSTHRFYGDFATITSSTDGPGSNRCRTEQSGWSGCAASYSQC